MISFSQLYENFSNPQDALQMSLSTNKNTRNLLIYTMQELVNSPYNKYKSSRNWEYDQCEIRINRLIVLCNIHLREIRKSYPAHTEYDYIKRIMSNIFVHFRVIVCEEDFEKLLSGQELDLHRCLCTQKIVTSDWEVGQPKIYFIEKYKKSTDLYKRVRNITGITCHLKYPHSIYLPLIKDALNIQDIEKLKLKYIEKLDELSSESRPSCGFNPLSFNYEKSRGVKVLYLTMWLVNVLHCRYEKEIPNSTIRKAYLLALRFTKEKYNDSTMIIISLVVVIILLFILLKLK